MKSSIAFLNQGYPCIQKGAFLGMTTLACQRITPDHCSHRRPKRSSLLQMRNGSEEEIMSENPLYEGNNLMNDDDFIIDVEEDEIDLNDESDLIDVSDTNKRKKVRASIEKLVDEINQESSATVTNDANTQPAIEDDETTVLAKTAAIAADQRKAEDVRVLRISKLSYIASFLVIATGKNTPQIRAISNIVQGEMKKKHKMVPKRVDGVANSGWILLDCMYQNYSFFVLHLRRYYQNEIIIIICYLTVNISSLFLSCCLLFENLQMVIC